MKTYQLKKNEIKREWHLIDAQDQILGRLATKIARLLIGKHKPTFVPHLDCGDYVVVINAAKIKVTGRKLKNKIYYRHTGYMGGLKEVRLEEMLAKDPTRVIWLAVKNMLPKNKLRKRRLKRLKIFAEENHRYQDKIQKPKTSSRGKSAFSRKSQHKNSKLEKKN